MDWIGLDWIGLDWAFLRDLGGGVGRSLGRFIGGNTWWTLAIALCLSYYDGMEWDGMNNV